MLITYKSHQKPPKTSKKKDVDFQRDAYQLAYISTSPPLGGAWGGLACGLFIIFFAKLRIL
jgi:hypothetical protein